VYECESGRVLVSAGEDESASATDGVRSIARRLGEKHAEANVLENMGKNEYASTPDVEGEKV
jgi:hypothetical protein